MLLAAVSEEKSDSKGTDDEESELKRKFSRTFHSFHVYSIYESGQTISVRRSVKEFRPMYVNLYDDHCSYITSINGFSQAFVCWKCDNFWQTLPFVTP